MGLNNIAVGVGVGVTLIATVAYYLFQYTRYMTNNQNAIQDNFAVYRGSQCPICYENLDEPNSVILNCGHEIHEGCLREMDNHRMYFETNRCPVCRTPIRLQ